MKILKEAEERSKREDLLLKKREEQAERYDEILKKWEMQLGTQQK
jgi:hypothetical protein